MKCNTLRGLDCISVKNEMSSHHIVNLIPTRIFIKPFGAGGHADINILKLGCSPEASTLPVAEKRMSYFSHT